MIKNINLKKAYRLINSGPVVLVTSAYKGNKNVMTLNWITVINSSPFLVGIGIGEESYTCSLIRKSREFAINIHGREILNKVKICGSFTGGEVDKFKKAKLSLFKGDKIKSPLIKDCHGFIECKVVKCMKFEDVYFFVGKAVSGRARKGYFKNGLWDLKKIKLIHHLGSGNFYFS